MILILYHGSVIEILITMLFCIFNQTFCNYIFYLSYKLIAYFFFYNIKSIYKSTFSLGYNNDLKKKIYVMQWLRNGHMIPISIYLSLLTKPLQALCCRHFQFSRTDLDTTYSYTNSNITSYTSTLALSKGEVLYIL